MKKHAAISIFLLWTASELLFGQLVTVKTEFETDSILLGEQISFIITAEAGLKTNLELPHLGDTLTTEIEILSSFPADTMMDGDTITVSKEYLITSFTPGWNTIPPLPVKFETDILSDTIYSTAGLLTVLAPAVDTTQTIKPIKPPVNTPLSFAEVFPIILMIWGGLLILTLFIALAWILLKKEKVALAVPSKPLEPAHIIAFRELEKLKADDLPSSGLIKDYYSRLTEIIRRYITRQYEIHAMESTSAEILEAFRYSNPGEEELTERLEELLMLADLVKFAREAPGQRENEQHYSNAWDFIEQTFRLFQAEQEEVDKDQGDNADNDVEPVKLEENNA